jgi:hypothetical protein
MCPAVIKIVRQFLHTPTDSQMAFHAQEEKNTKKNTHTRKKTDVLHLAKNTCNHKCNTSSSFQSK